ncbi:MAG TPA: hypothetical protein VMV77_05205 [Bacteroidales bacterium]|nr:hypothetical protein [Bacteroidales bacterium]
MRNYIIITKEQADEIRGRHGRYSAIEPVELPDGNFMVPERCIDDPDLKEVKSKLQEYVKPSRANVQDIRNLPKVGEPIKQGAIYKCVPDKEDEYSGLVIAVKDSTMIDCKPDKRSDLFLSSIAQVEPIKPK